MRFHQWLALLEHRAQEATEILQRAARSAAETCSRRPGDVADIAQEVMARVLESLLTLETRVPEGTSLEAWVFGIARNVGREAARKRPRRLLPLEGNVEDIAQPDSRHRFDDSAFTSVEAAAHRNESLRMLVDLIRRLPPPDKQIAQMLLRGCTRAEIAVYLHRWRGVGSEEARRLIKRTKHTLKACWGRNPHEVFPDRYVKNNPWTTPP